MKINLGGSVEAAGNAPNDSEYNFHIDPDSAAYVLKNCNIPIEMFGLEVANDKVLTSGQYEQFNSKYNENMNSKLTKDIKKEGDIELLTDQKHLDNICPQNLIQEVINANKEAAGYDSVVAYYIINPHAFVLKHIDICVDSSTGRTTASALVNNVDSEKVNSSIQIQLATEFNRNDYFNYLSNIFQKNI